MKKAWILTISPGPTLFLLTFAIASAQYVALPCHFNSMCSCKITQPSIDYPKEAEAQNQTLLEINELLAHGTNKNNIPITPSTAIEDDLNQDSGAFDISCVGVPFAFLPALPAGKIAHVDIVSSGLEVADFVPSPTMDITRTRIESLRLMSNKIRHIGDNMFRGMENDLKSLDLSYNELDEIPAVALKALRALDWANFHSNQIASLEGLGHLWTHLSSSLDALFLGNNDILTLQRSQGEGQWGNSNHHSLSLLRGLNWLNVDGNHLTELPPDTLPLQLHTLSAANNRITNFPSKCVEQLHDLRWLDLRGNFIQHLPVDFIRPESGNKLRLKKLDLGENLIVSLPDGGAVFNRSLHIRDLYLDFNRINRLPDSPFRGTNIARLYLASNGLTTIDERAFHSLSSTLILLDLDRNKLRDYPVALDHLRKLRFLYLANNQITHLSQGDFASFGSHLEELSLAGNNLEEFPASVLTNCPKLIHLNIAYNTIENLTSEMLFGWSNNLEVLILKGNRINQLPERLFQFTTKLRELSLSFNKLTAVHDAALIDVGDTLEILEMNMALERSSFPTGLLKPLRQLQFLSLEYNRIVSLPSSAMDHCQNLRYLSLEGNRLGAINGGHFKSEHLRSLRDIRLSYNAIESLVPRTFHSLAEVTTVVLTNNRIHTIQQFAFDNLPKLVTVNLAYNRIEQIELHAFRGLPNLLKLDMQSNKLREFSWDVMSNCTNAFMAASLNLSDNLISHLQTGKGLHETNRLHIKTIDLRNNLLSEFPDTTFLSVLVPNSLKKLLLGNNKIAALADGILQINCHDLQVLELQQNSIEELGRLSMSGAINLQVVNLSDNWIEHIPSGFFANMKRLRVINLANNKIRSLPKDIFDESAVETLIVAHNYLNSLPICLLSISSTLVNFDASYNQIDHLDALMLSNAPNLVSLNLAHNKLTLLPDNVFSYLNSLISLDLSYNTIRANFKELFHEIQHVKELNLAGIGLSRWPNLPLPNLIALNLSSNALDYRTADHIPSNVVIRLDRLRSLDLSRNRFTLVPAFLWPATPVLKYLDLSSNPIRIINRDSFAGLIRLQTLSLQPLPVLETIDGDSMHSLFFMSHIKMQTWPGPHLSQLLGGMRGLKKLSLEVRGPVLSSQLNYIATIDAAPKLKELDITGLQLKTVYSDVFANTGIYTSPECSITLKHTAIKHLPERFINGLEGCASLTLDLRRNSLQTLGLHSIRHNNSLSTTSTRHLTGGLWLENNQWICSCENAWLGYWLKRWYLETSSIRHPVSTLPLSSVSCRDPVSLRKRYLVDLPTSENACNVAATAAVSVSLHNQSIFAPVALLSLIYVLFQCQVLF